MTAEEREQLIISSEEYWVCEKHADQGDKWLVVNQSRFCVDCLEQLLLENILTLKNRDAQA